MPQNVSSMIRNLHSRKTKTPEEQYPDLVAEYAHQIWMELELETGSNWRK